MTRLPLANRPKPSSSPFRFGRGFLALATCVMAVALGAGIAGCAFPSAVANGADAAATRTFTAMDTGMTITAYAADQAAADDAVQTCEERIRELDALLGPADDGSELAQMNAAEGAPSDASSSVSALVEASLEVARETDGAFDPTVYPLTDAWGFTDGDHRVPAPNEIASLLARVGYESVAVDESDGTITLGHGAQIDLGGAAKGFAADALTSLLLERGASSALLDLGGNVTALGSKPDGESWNVGIADPSVPKQLAGTLAVRNATVSTSGAYQRFFDEDGKRYHHLIDPATGYPAASDLASVSVVGPNATRCDALSTACYVMGLDKALSFWRTTSPATSDEAFDLVLIENDGTVHVTEGIAASFTLAEGRADRMIVEARS